MELQEFRRRGHELVDWMTDFLESIEQYPVKSKVAPGEILSQLPSRPPESSESFDTVFRDFQDIIMPGMTHWQHPSFFAYFPANSSPPSVLAEMLTATLGAQCMSWQTSPAATELEERVMDWLRDMIGLDDGFQGVIQDTASTSTLVSILTARERVTNYEANEHGLPRQSPLTLYCSSETHSSIEKDAKIAGIGRENIRFVEVDENYAMIPERLDEAIIADLRAGLVPCCVVATLGTTGSTAVDPLRSIGEICRRHDVWLHVDAALAGTALLLPQMRWMTDGLEYVDTFVFNPHKWMFTNFDCSAYFVRDREALTRTFEIHPEYLRTAEGRLVNNYRDWGIQLGRRFRALKLWFVIRTYGVAGIRDRVAKHLELAAEIAQRAQDAPDFELLAPAPLNTVCLRYHPTDIENTETLNALNEKLLETVNAGGEMYVTHTKLRGNYTIRFVVGQTNVERRHVEAGWDLIVRTARSLDTSAAKR
ncbi:MAG: pyridoxal phosphate-dependent decarboxylase family protein [Spirochaetaceae bacterium]